MMASIQNYKRKWYELLKNKTIGFKCEFSLSWQLRFWLKKGSILSMPIQLMVTVDFTKEIGRSFSYVNKHYLFSRKTQIEEDVSSPQGDKVISFYLLLSATKILRTTCKNTRANCRVFSVEDIIMKPLCVTIHPNWSAILTK